MFDDQLITHPIQKYILKILTHQKYARFRDMKKPNVDSNLYSYHLRTVVRKDFVEKTNKGYKLTSKGLMYADNISWENQNPRIQPKVTTTILLKNHKNEILLTKRDRQPFIACWNFPSGKIHLSDVCLADAASRELSEKIGLNIAEEDFSRVGEAYVRVISGDSAVSYVFTHIFVVKIKHDFIPENAFWTNAVWRKSNKLAPAVDDIINLEKTRKKPFFVELNYEINPN